jgi:purine-binding chemotaxis protein CheW
MTDPLAGQRADIGEAGLVLMTPTQALSTGLVFIPELGEQVPIEPLLLVPGEDGQQRRQGFRIGPLALMIRYEDAREVTEMPSVYQLPNAPDWFRGMANLNGVPTPVFELARYLGFERSPQAKPMLLVLSHGADAAGVVIDGLPERLRWSSTDRTDASTVPPRLAPYQRGAWLIGERLWFDLECAALLDALEDAMRPAS